MTCTELELLLCDYIDGTLPADERSQVESHLASCSTCAELAADAAAIVSFVERVADVNPPPALVTRILQQVPTSQPAPVRARSAAGRWFRRFLDPILQPRLVMGMAMTILSFAMLGRFSGIEARQLRAGDLNPVKVWEASEDRMHRGWNRTVKYYQSLRIVYEVQAMLRDLTESEDDSATPREPVSTAPDASKTGAPK